MKEVVWREEVEPFCTELVTLSVTIVDHRIAVNEP